MPGSAPAQVGWEGATAERLNPRYVLTIDNLLKMLSIALRIKYGMPVIVSGETGCGKSSLTTAMCAILGWKLHTLNIHGGMTDRDVIDWMHGVVREVEASERCAAVPDCNSGRQLLLAGCSWCP